MALKGTLRDFGLSDIFQLISHQRKAGILYLEDKGKSVAVTFDEGKVVGAEIGSAKTQEKERVGDILVKSGLIDMGRLEECLQEQKRTSKKLGVILTEKNYLTEELFRAALAFQIKETLYKIFQWGNGTYKFDSGKISYDKQFISPLPAEYILMEAARIIDEWPGVQNKVPSMEMVFAKVPDAEEKIIRSSRPGADAEEEDDLDFDILGEEKPRSYESDKILLSGGQEKVFDLVNGQFTVSDVAYRSLLGDFEASKALVDLSGFGLIKPVKVPASRPKTEETARETKKRRGVIAMVSGLLFAAALLFVLFTLAAKTGGKLNLLTQISSTRTIMVRQAVVSAQQQRLLLALETYRLEKGSYPLALEDLVQAGFVLESDISYPFSTPYTIVWSESRPVISPPGE
ncbi:MAG: DUF4388 domain-containing protein [bacterium]|nr:DUF4388 domain-containing protein [bacterium]MDT8396487.1 DUF4388 domain-containing protein [bacterium]